MDIKAKVTPHVKDNLVPPDPRLPSEASWAIREMGRINRCNMEIVQTCDVVQLLWMKWIAAGSTHLIRLRPNCHGSDKSQEITVAPEAVNLSEDYGKLWMQTLPAYDNFIILICINLDSQRADIGGIIKSICTEMIVHQGLPC